MHTLYSNLQSKCFMTLTVLELIYYILHAFHCYYVSQVQNIKQRILCSNFLHRKSLINYQTKLLNRKDVNVAHLPYGMDFSVKVNQFIHLTLAFLCFQVYIRYENVCTDNWQAMEYKIVYYFQVLTKAVLSEKTQKLHNFNTSLYKYSNPHKCSAFRYYMILTGMDQGNNIISNQ